MNKLFDNGDEPLDEDDNLNDDQQDDTDEEFIPKLSHDKIFGNDYNTGNLDFEEYNLPKVDTFYAEDNLRECYDSYEYNRKKELEAKVDTYFI